MLHPYNLGSFLVSENCDKIKIDELVHNAQKVLKMRLLQSQIDAFGADVNLTTSKTKFNGERFWFSCPNCKKRVGVLYKHPVDETIACRICLNLKYRKQRFKGMIEENF